MLIKQKNLLVKPNATIYTLLLWKNKNIFFSPFSTSASRAVDNDNSWENTDSLYVPPVDKNKSNEELRNELLKNKNSSIEAMQKYKDSLHYEAQKARNACYSVWNQYKQNVSEEVLEKEDRDLPDKNKFKNLLPSNPSDEEKSLASISNQLETLKNYNVKLQLLKNSQGLESSPGFSQMLEHRLNNNLSRNNKVFENLEETANLIAKNSKANNEIRNELQTRKEHLTPDLSSLDTEMPEHFGPESD